MNLPSVAFGARTQLSANKQLAKATEDLKNARQEQAKWDKAVNTLNDQYFSISTDTDALRGQHIVNQLKDLSKQVKKGNITKTDSGIIIGRTPYQLTGHRYEAFPELGELDEGYTLSRKDGSMRLTYSHNAGETYSDRNMSLTKSDGKTIISSDWPALNEVKELIYKIYAGLK